MDTSSRENETPRGRGDHKTGCTRSTRTERSVTEDGVLLRCEGNPERGLGCDRKAFDGGPSFDPVSVRSGAN